MGRERERENARMHAGERVREKVLWLLFLYVFSSTWACPMQIGLSQECCLFCLKFSLWSLDLPLTFLVFQPPPFWTPFPYSTYLTLPFLCHLLLYQHHFFSLILPLSYHRGLTQSYLETAFCPKSCQNAKCPEKNCYLTVKNFNSDEELLVDQNTCLNFKFLLFSLSVDSVFIVPQSLQPRCLPLTRC